MDFAITGDKEKKSDQKTDKDHITPFKCGKGHYLSQCDKRTEEQTMKTSNKMGYNFLVVNDNNQHGYSSDKDNTARPPVEFTATQEAIEDDEEMDDAETEEGNTNDENEVTESEDDKDLEYDDDDELPRFRFSGQWHTMFYRSHGRHPKELDPIGQPVYFGCVLERKPTYKQMRCEKCTDSEL